MKDDILFLDLPITAAEADRSARLVGYRLVGIEPGMEGFEDRFLATFLPLDEQQRDAIVADGRTAFRALRRGLAVCWMRDGNPPVPGPVDPSERWEIGDKTINLLQKNPKKMIPGAKSGEIFWDIVVGAVPVDCGDVNRHLRSLTDRERERFAIRELPAVIPPFDTTMFFWPADSGDVFGKAGFDEIIVVTSSGRLTDDGEDIPATEALAMMVGVFDSGGGVVEPGNPNPPTGFARYEVDCFFAARRGARLFGPLACVGLLLREDGSAVTSTAGEILTVSSLHHVGAMNANEVYALIECLRTPLNACALMHCKNVKLVEEGGRWPSRQRRNLAARRGEPLPPKFYTLAIDPGKPGTPSVEEAGSASERVQRALHICRGHFAHYTDDKPLFGKYAGTFWVPSHVRGTADVGMVGKDYAIKAPKDGAA